MVTVSEGIELSGSERLATDGGDVAGPAPGSGAVRFLTQLRGQNASSLGTPRLLAPQRRRQAIGQRGLPRRPHGGQEMAEIECSVGRALTTRCRFRPSDPDQTDADSEREDRWSENRGRRSSWASSDWSPRLPAASGSSARTSCSPIGLVDAGEFGATGECYSVMLCEETVARLHACVAGRFTCRATTGAMTCGPVGAGYPPKRVTPAAMNFRAVFHYVPADDGRLVTADFLDEGRSPAGWSAEQLALLGVPWPPAKVEGRCARQAHPRRDRRPLPEVTARRLTRTTRPFPSSLVSGVTAGCSTQDDSTAGRTRAATPADLAVKSFTGTSARTPA